MEQNKDLNKDNVDEGSEKEVNLDELVNSLPERVSINEPESFKSENFKQEKPKFEGYKTNSFFYYFLCVFGVFFLSIFYVFQIYLQPIVVVGHSMLPNINTSALSDEDDVHCDVVYYRQKETYNYGDVIIISNLEDQYMDDSNQDEVSYFIKRVIACPGDTITFYLTDVSEDSLHYYYDISVTTKNGDIIELNEESYINEPMYLIKNQIYPGLLNQIAQNLLDNTLGLDNRKFSITINENCYFAMGDNRNHSLDSRYFGEISKEDICGDMRIHVKYGENIWIALFNKLKSYLSVYNYNLKENLWEKKY